LRVTDLEGRPFGVEAGTEEEWGIRFESEGSKRQYPDIPVEHPIGHHVKLDNPRYVMIKEG